MDDQNISMYSDYHANTLSLNYRVSWSSSHHILFL